MGTEQCPAGLSNAASDGRGLCSPVPGAAAFDFQAVMEDFEKNIAILRKNFYKEEYLK